MKKIAEHFASELQAAGLQDGVTVYSDGRIAFTNASDQHKTAVLALLDAHDPHTPPLAWWLDRVVRPERNRHLAASDWTQVPDSPLTTEQKQAWATYRQALRDLPAALAEVADPVPWPAEPPS